MSRTVNRSACFSLLLVAWLAADSARGQDANTPPHPELRAVRDAMVAAYNRGDMDALLAYCHPNIRVTWQNGEVSRGPAGIRQYHDRMLVGENRIVDKMTADPSVDEVSLIYGGDTAVAVGQMNDHYLLHDGQQFDLHSRWSATLVKENDKWLVANFHASTNAFDNDILRLVASKTAWWASIIAGSAGFMIAIVFLLLMRRLRSRPAAA